MVPSRRRFQHDGWVFSLPELPPSFLGTFVPKALESSYKNRVILEIGCVPKPGTLKGSAKSGAIDNRKDFLSMLRANTELNNGPAQPLSVIVHLLIKLNDPLYQRVGRKVRSPITHTHPTRN